MTTYELVANILIAGGVNKPAFVEQFANYVLTGLGDNAAGDANTPKSVDIPSSALGGHPVSYWAGAYIAFGVTDPAGIEKVGNIALLHS